MLELKFIYTSIFSFQSCVSLYHFVFRLLNFERSHFFFGEKLPMVDTRVKSHITEHIPIIKHFSMFSSFLNQIERCWCHWMCNWRATSVLWISNVKDQHKKHMKRMSESLLQFFWKNNSRPFSSSSPISSSFLV
jgi:hypothetical protein